jgi:outer membrane protein assembly factor BamB
MYRGIFGVGLKEAKDAVENIEAGRPIGMLSTSFSTQEYQAQASQPAQPQLPKSSGGTKGCVWVMVISIVALVAFGAPIASLVFKKSPKISSKPPSAVVLPKSASTAPAPPAFATSALEFGSEGTGAGQFKDARTVAVDGQGRIYVGEYSSGRIQVFDQSGTFISQFLVDQKSSLIDMSVDRNGTVYAVNPSHIVRYDGSTGSLLGELPKSNNGTFEFYSAASVALDGSVYAIGSNSNILEIGPDGKIKRTIKVAEKVGEDVDLQKLAVTGTGEIYAIGRKEEIFRFARDGRYISRFGGSGDGNGQLRSASAIAVDGKGHVFVSDVGRGIQVFDLNGRYLNSFGGTEVVFGITVNDKDEIFATERNKHRIVKFAQVN